MEVHYSDTDGLKDICIKDHPSKKGELAVFYGDDIIKEGPKEKLELLIQYALVKEQIHSVDVQMEMEANKPTDSEELMKWRFERNRIEKIEALRKCQVIELNQGLLQYSP